MSAEPNMMMTIVDGDDLEASRPARQITRADLDLGAGNEPMRVG